MNDRIWTNREGAADVADFCISPALESSSRTDTLHDLSDEEGDPVARIAARVLHDDERASNQRLPIATYRVQLNSDCTFRDAAALTPYLHRLGISDVYASPFLKARPGSRHGYDIVDHTAINPEIGTLAELRALRGELRRRGMGLLADVVPNHMSNAPQLNEWWRDVLENGPSSTYASYFDIDWMPRKPDLADKVLLPVLGDQFGKVLEAGQLSVRYAAGAYWLDYFEQRFPLAPRSYVRLLAPRLDELQQRLGERHDDVLELLSILTSIKNLPPRTETSAERLVERRREKEVIKRRLHELVERSADVAAFVAENVRRINGQVGDPRSFDTLDELLQDQAYRLADWRVAADEINYRRFFDINELAAICTEQPAVFAHTHRAVFALLDEGTLTGLRIDHPDGLYDPRGYLRQLQEEDFLQRCRRAYAEFDVAAEGTTSSSSSEAAERLRVAEERWREAYRAASAARSGGTRPTLFVVVEKILARNEVLPENWPVHGTVGYEFLNTVNGLLVDHRGERPLSAFYSRFTGQSLDFDVVARQCKRLIVKMSMGSELQLLGHHLDRISERNRWTRDFTLNSLTRALQEVVACFSVYRTYVEPDNVFERDVFYVGRAVARAKRQNPAMSASIFDFVRDVLLLRWPENADEGERRDIQRLVGRFQQLTGPIMAKAVEDTAFYRFNRLVSLNEVGGHPANFGTTIGEFHQLNRSRLPRWSHTLNATSTHDTKRSEDVRARINVLSEVPRTWRDCVQRWSRWHRRLKTNLEGSEVPCRNVEYLLYQTLAGVWPGSGVCDESFRARLQGYMLKVVREAKVDTSWVSPNLAYEAALAKFVDGVLRCEAGRLFQLELDDLAAKVADHGMWNSLTQVLLKVGAPGVPDFYQGTEVWSRTLVDPDNRQPVNVAALQESLDGLLRDMAAAANAGPDIDAVHAWFAWSDASTQSAAQDQRLAEQLDARRRFLHELLCTRADGRVKQFVTLLALQARRRRPELFTGGEYFPLETRGAFAEHVVAFLRRRGAELAVIVTPRLTVGITGLGGPAPLGEWWNDTTVVWPESLPHPELQDCFTRTRYRADQPGRSADWRVADLLREFPLALLMDRHDATPAAVPEPPGVIGERSS